MDVIILGHIIIETIVFPNGKVLSPVLGSPAAYSSVTLARLGDRVGLCTKVGEDFPPAFLDIFRKAGVDLTGLRIEGKRSTCNRLIYSSLENKHIEYLSKAPEIKYSDIPTKGKESKLFYICPMDYEVYPEVARALVESGKEVIVDLGGYGGATSSSYPQGDASKLRTTEEIVRLSHLVKASVEDCACIFGEARRPYPEHYFAERLLTMGAKRLLLTLGSRGAYYADPWHNRYFPPLPCDAVDTTGAGDAFGAGIVHAYLIDKYDIDTMVKFGQATACYVIERTGGVLPERMPTQQEVLSRIRKE